MPAKVQVIFYSMYGHVWKLAEAIAEGARGAGADVRLLQVAETLPEAVLEKMGAVEAKKAFAHVPLADPISLPTRMRSFSAPGRATAAPPRRCNPSSTRRDSSGRGAH